ncbi:MULTISPECIES: hypothetical protein [Nonomuraea]|jgi:hypothetical protein|uniref:Lipoprotein n=1 Tax=Nonomuraea ferruginea TaxID=46174 RepID=A0ABT4SQR9_9ACTN|nr:hypothetical protein [Nonomuraea ferruginea]MDA0639260.1 hypothetical protein [Nonomuraea ferruginea]
MPDTKPADRDQAKGCGCLAVVLLVAAGCNALFFAKDPAPPAAYSPPPVPSQTLSWTPEASWKPDSAEDFDDLDEDGIEDSYDNDKDGDGVTKARDRDDRDASKGRPQKRTRKPEPKIRSEPAPLARAHPGGFCGTPGAAGLASNGRTYFCRGGHWRR